MNVTTNGLPSSLFSWTSDNTETRLPVIDDHVFQQIDQLNGNDNNDQVRFSSKAQFLFNIQSHAHTLNEQERNDFVDLLARIDEPLFDRGLLEFIRNPPVPVFADPAETYHPKTGLSDRVSTEPIIVVPTGVGTFNWQQKHTSSIGEFNPDSALLQKRFAELREQAFDELDKQDATTVTETVKHALEYGNKLITSAESIFHSNYGFSRSEYILNNLPLSDALKQGFGELINDARSAQNEMIVRYQQSLEQRLESFPQYADSFIRSINVASEAVQLNTRFQEFLANPSQDILNSSSYFRQLFEGASYLDRLSHNEMGRMFDYYERQQAEYERIFVKKDWLGESIVRATPETYEEEAFQTAELTKQFIKALNTYAQITDME